MRLRATGAYAAVLATNVANASVETQGITDAHIARARAASGVDFAALLGGQIKYVVISHAHGDHVGGAGFLQKRGARIVMAAADWDLMDATKATYLKPARDIVATDGQQLTLGDTTVTLHVTPGHTLGTISSLIPVKDGARRHVAAYWGGTAFNWLRNPAAYISADRPASFWFSQYAASARPFRELAGRAGADVLLSNHTNFDGSKAKIAALRTRSAGASHPYVVGKDAVRRYLTVAEECAQAGLATTAAGARR